MNKELENALNALADLYEYGHLQATTVPIDFIKQVVDEIKKLRKQEKNKKQGNSKMMHVLSEEEVEESNRKIEEWWTDLNRNLKLFLYQTFKPTFKQMHCVHEFKSPTLGDFKYCNKCNLTMEK